MEVQVQAQAAAGVATAAARGAPPSRETRNTELGEEVRCASCGDFWPADKEFFYFSGGKPHSWCKACYLNSPSSARKRAKYVEQQRAARAEKAEEEKAPTAAQECPEARPEVAPRRYGEPVSKTDQLRALIAQREMTASELADQVGLADSGVVSALLQKDIRAGRVVVQRRGVYRMGPGVTSGQGGGEHA